MLVRMRSCSAVMADRDERIPSSEANDLNCASCMAIFCARRESMSDTIAEINNGSGDSREKLVEYFSNH